MQRVQHFRAMTRIVAYNVRARRLVPHRDSHLRRTRFAPTGEAGTLHWWQMTSTSGGGGDESNDRTDGDDPDITGVSIRQRFGSMMGAFGVPR